jgi:hypothetical protein
MACAPLHSLEHRPILSEKGLMREVSPVQNWLLIVLVMAGSGVLYNVLFFEDSRLFIGAIFALCMGMPIIAFERKVVLRGLYGASKRCRPSPFISQSCSSTKS